MKSATQCLQPSDIEALLAGTAQAWQIELWEEHFSSCESCRMAMASQVGDPKWWHEAEQSLLQPVGESLQVSQIRLGEAAQRELADERESLEELLKLLGPTDDPKFMGRIGSYEVLGVLGRGGMGIVFKAFDAPLNRFVAIKMLLPHLAASGAARKRFAREGQAAAAVVDDYVLPIYAVSEWKGVPYLVTQYSRGTTLQKRVQSEGPLELKEILRLGMQTARGLAAAHAQGLVHRDVKPSNILLDGSVERAMLTDFGLARAVDDASITRTGVIAGTPQYMSPEQARGGSVDARSDLFSLGCVLYFLCTGHPPFRADNSYAILRLITDEEPRSIREINPDIPAWLCSVVQKLMAKKAEDRYGSASEVADVLEECLAHVQQPTTVALPVSLRNRTKLDQRTFGSVARGVAILVLMLVVCVGCFMFLQSSPPPDIAGVWRSIEWGTVTMQAEGEGKYRGSITDALLAAGTNPHADHPTLKNLDWSQIQCTVCHEGQRGTVELSWSEAERRFNGTWQIETRNGIPKSGNITGKLSVHRVGNQLRGASTCDDETPAFARIPRLADFAWEQSSERKKGYEHSDAMQQFIESLSNEPPSDRDDTKPMPPDVTRVIEELEKQRGLERNSIRNIYEQHKDRFRFTTAIIYDNQITLDDYPEIGSVTLKLVRYECHIQVSDIESVRWPLRKKATQELELDVVVFIDAHFIHRQNPVKTESAGTEVTKADDSPWDTKKPYAVVEAWIRAMASGDLALATSLSVDLRIPDRQQHAWRDVFTANKFTERFTKIEENFWPPVAAVVLDSIAGNLALVIDLELHGDTWSITDVEPYGGSGVLEPLSIQRSVSSIKHSALTVEDLWSLPPRRYRFLTSDENKEDSQTHMAERVLPQGVAFETSAKDDQAVEPFLGDGFDWWQDPWHHRTFLPEGIEIGRADAPLYSQARQSLADAVRELNEQSAEDRRTLFAPPIPDMTEEQLRKGLVQQAELYRQDGKNDIADLLDRIAKSGDVPRDGKTSRIFLGGEILKSTDKKQILRKQIAPAITVAESSGSPRRVVVIETLMLRFCEAGRTSKTYGDKAERNSDPSANKVPIKILLSAGTHSPETMNRNWNKTDKITLQATGVMGRIEGSEIDVRTTVVIAHDCTLDAFEYALVDGEKFFWATFLVPIQPQILDLRPGQTLEEAESKFDAKAFQDRLDNMWKDGVRFEMHQYLGEKPKAVPIPAVATAALPARDRLSSASRLVTTIPGVDHLEADLKTLLDLTSKTEQRQWVHVQGYLDTLFDGVEKTRPIEIQHVPSIGDGSTLLWMPLPEGDNSFKVFRANLESLGYILRQEKHDAESVLLHRMIQEPEHGWIRIDLEEKLACIALTERVEAMDALRDQIVAAKPVANPADCSLAIAMTNADHSAEAQEYRRRAFQSYRDQTIKHMAAKGPGVLPAQLNDWLTTTWLDEYQLLSAEGSKISARVVLDRSKPAQANAEMTFTASAIQNTALATSLSQLASSNDAYATWPTAESSILSLRVNAPVSQLRQDKLQSLNNWFATELRKPLISLNEQGGRSKVAADQLATGCRQILSDVILSGRCNAIIESSLVDGQLQWIGSMMVPKPQLMTELLPLMTKLQSENEVALTVRRIGNVDVHRVKITGRLQELLQSILQSDGQYYVGCDADKIWFACGPNALDSLVARIETLGPAQPRPDVFHLNARVGTLMAPLIRVYEQRSQQSGPADPQQRQTQRWLHRLLGDLKDSTTNDDDSLSIHVHASDDALNATIKCDTGILRFFGKQVARFSSENFQ